MDPLGNEIGEMLLVPLNMVHVRTDGTLIPMEPMGSAPVEDSIDFDALSQSQQRRLIHEYASTAALYS